LLLEEALFYKDQDATLYIKATGHITAAICLDLRDRVYSRLTIPDDIKEIIFDLSECDYMDSTFMGLLVGFNKKYKSRSGKNLIIRKPSPECIQLLKGLGILRLLRISETDEWDIPQDMEKINRKKNPTAEILLNAHEDLIQISDENKEKFSLLQKILRDQLDQTP